MISEVHVHVHVYDTLYIDWPHVYSHVYFSYINLDCVLLPLQTQCAYTSSDGGGVCECYGCLCPIGFVAFDGTCMQEVSMPCVCMSVCVCAYVWHVCKCACVCVCLCTCVHVKTGNSLP